jgi:anti-sigma factor RsiW
MIGKHLKVNPDSQSLKWIMRYLLGELSEKEQSQLEERYFADPAFFQEVRARRDDLIDAYLRGDLSEHERERFDTHFMASPHLRERVEFARALIETVDHTARQEAILTREPAPVAWWKSLLAPLVSYPRAITATVILAMIGIGAWIVIRITHVPRQVAWQEANQAAHEHNAPMDSNINKSAEHLPSSAEQQTNTKDNLSGKPRVPASKTEIKLATFALTTALVRDSAETKVLVIPRDVDLVQLNLEVERNGNRGYRAVLRTLEGAEIWSKEIKNQAPQRHHIVLRLPASLLKRADYIITLSALTADKEAVDVRKYYFRVQVR